LVKKIPQLAQWFPHLAQKSPSAKSKQIHFITLGLKQQSKIIVSYKTYQTLLFRFGQVCILQ
jgi:hypothetical protein